LATGMDPQLFMNYGMAGMILLVFFTLIREELRQLREALVELKDTISDMKETIAMNTKIIEILLQERGGKGEKKG